MAKRKSAPKPAKADTKRSPLKISPENMSRANAKATSETQFAAMLAAAQPPPGVLPKGHKLAMDEAFSPVATWGAGQLYNGAFSQGYSFLGYAYLSELTVVPEYRLISDVISTEATRKWIKMVSISEDETKKERIAELEAEFLRLNVKQIFQNASEQDGWFGRSHVFVDVGDVDNREEQRKPIGDGTGDFTAKKFKKGFLKALRNVEPLWAYPSNYNATNPLKDSWYRPDEWFVMAQPVHATRFLTFVSKPVPDLLKPSYSFGGLSMTQMAKPYVDNWLQTRQNVNALIQAFSIIILQTDMSTTLQGLNGDDIFARIDFFNAVRNNKATMAINKDSEDVKNIAVPLGTLDKLQAQAQEHMASVSRIPLVKLLGITPSGLNASSDGEIRSFYDTIHSYQEKFFSPNLWTVFRLAQINLWGEVDADLSFQYEPLWELDEVQLAGMRKTQAETAATYVDKGILAPEEERQRLVDEPNSDYANIDPDEVPEVEGPEPEHVRETEEDKLDGPEGQADKEAA